jgi:hypothetical protein
MQLKETSQLRQQLWRSYKALGTLLRSLSRDKPMVQGSFYLLRRKCGNPNCRCARGQLHSSWVITRSEGGKDRLYSVPPSERARLRVLTAEYRRYQRSRARLVKSQPELVAWIDQLAQARMITWPAKDGS